MHFLLLKSLIHFQIFVIPVGPIEMNVLKTLRLKMPWNAGGARIKKN
jgi:hypothetical protein